MKEVLTVGEVAKRSGVATSALRFYEERGLIRSERNASGHRRYPRAVIRRIAFIVFAQKIGLTLEEIGRQLAKLPQNRIPESSDWAKLSGRERDRILQSMSEGFPPEYRTVLERYYRRLAEEKTVPAGGNRAQPKAAPESDKP